MRRGHGQAGVAGPPARQASVPCAAAPNTRHTARRTCAAARSAPTNRPPSRQPEGPWRSAAAASSVAASAASRCASPGASPGSGPHGGSASCPPSRGLRGRNRGPLAASLPGRHSGPERQGAGAQSALGGQGGRQAGEQARQPHAHMPWPRRGPHLWCRTCTPGTGPPRNSGLALNSPISSLTVGPSPPPAAPAVAAAPPPLLLPNRPAVPNRELARPAPAACDGSGCCRPCPVCRRDSSWSTR